MNSEILIALFSKLIDERLKSLPVATVGPRGHRGPTGEVGSDGKDFSIEEHGPQIRAWVKEFALKFEDFTAEDIEKLRGPRGLDGRNGVDGQSFSIEEHGEYIRNWAKEFALKFEDLSSEEIEKLRGPRGLDGKDGVDGLNFNFEEHRADIELLISEEIENSYEDLKLKFEDLTADEIAQLRGPQGRPGRDGRDFIFEEHRGFFESLKLKFSDFTAEELDQLKLKFEQLTPEERATLRLKFEDLTDEQRDELRGPRGLRGQRGKSGRDGTDGRDGLSVRGLPGPTGISGRDGVDGRDGAPGRDGEPGRDAPIITDVKVSQDHQKFTLEFIMSDGSSVETPSIIIPTGNTYYAVGYGGNSSGGTPGADGKSAYEVAVENGFVGTEEEWLESLVGPEGPQGIDGKSAYEVAVDNGFVGTEEEWLESLVGPQGPPGTSGKLSGVTCLADVFVGSAVILTQDSATPIPMEDWPSLAVLVSTDVNDFNVVAENALADAWSTSNVVGIVESKSSSTSCDILVLGVSGDLYLGLNTGEEYFLSDVDPGKLVSSESKPTTPGHVVVKIGQAVDPYKILYMREDRNLIEEVDAVDFETQMDEASDTVTYIGKAAVGSDTDESVWQIQRISIAGTITSIEWASSTAAFDKVWDDRAGYTYG